MNITGNNYDLSLQICESATAAEVLIFSLTYLATKIESKKLIDSFEANLSPAELLYAVIFSRVLQA